MSEQELQLKRIADELDKIRWRISMGLYCYTVYF
jgi:hypothetical protein